MKTCFIDRRFSHDSLEIIEHANNIIIEYSAQGFSLTLRQLYYQFVSRDLIVNKQSEYKRLGSVINDGRLAGLIDWLAIEDRTRNLQSLTAFESPEQILTIAHDQYRTDKWAFQPYHIEVWIEKDALTGVIEPICNELEIPYFACRGYNSQSEQYRAAMRFKDYVINGQDVIVLHLGDHDPSGIDMTRDNEERIRILMGDYYSSEFNMARIALNMDQIEEYDPPPNPTKFTDSRSNSYVSQYGDSSWELDALEPKVISNLIRNHVDHVIDRDAWAKSIKREKADKLKIKKAITSIN